MGGRLRALVSSALTIAAVAVPVATATVTQAATPPTPNGFSVQLGAEERVFGPSTQVDMPFHTTLGYDKVLRGYIANGDTSELKLSSTGAFTSTRIALKRGAKGSFDQCGAWLMGSIYKDPANARHWVGFYHAEAAHNANNWCAYSNGATRWSMAIAESYDAGATWQKKSYSGFPNNQVITQDTNLLNDPFTEDAGNGRVVVKDGYFYMLYQAASRTDGERKLNIARAPLSSFGRPGTWKKYKCTPLLGCSWSQTGLGGQSTQLAGIPPTARSVVWNDYLGRYVSVAASGRYGFSLWQSTDLIKWTARTSTSGQSIARYIYPAVTSPGDATVDKWSDRKSYDKGLYGYSSLVSTTLDSARTGQDMWLYYMKVFPGEGFDKRYLMRRKLSLVATSAPADRVQLTTYVAGKTARYARRTSSEMPNPGLGFKVESSAGYLLADAGSGYAPLFECATTKGDRYLRQNICAKPDWVVRRVGYVSVKRTTAAKTPLWRCLDTVAARHFAATGSSTDPTAKPAKCTATGKRAEFVIGYVLPALR